ncbi:hypothetical protein D9M68_790920 [compost metagenome]
MAQVARDARLGGRAPAAGERERIAGQVAGLGQPSEAGVQDDHRLAHAARRQRPGKRAPVRMAARELLAAGQNPARGWLRIGQEALVGQQVLVRERGQWLAQLQHGPQDQSLHLAAVGLERRRAVGIAREPGGDGGEVVGCSNAGGRGRRTVAAVAPGQCRRQAQLLQWRWQCGEEAGRRRGGWMDGRFQGRGSVGGDSSPYYRHKRIYV